MDLETRVTTVERDVAVVRELEIPSLRSEMERKYDYMRNEANGWFKVAVDAGNKVTAAGEIVTLIYHDLRELKEGQARHNELIGGLATDVATLKSDVATLKEGIGTLKGDVGSLQGDVTTLKKGVADQREILDRHGELLDEHGRILGQHSAMLGKVVTRLDDHRDMLQKILAKLS